VGKKGMSMCRQLSRIISWEERAGLEGEDIHSKVKGV
jgi:hypothetical protein